jgi:hypothetical protein
MASFPRYARQILHCSEMVGDSRKDAETTPELYRRALHQLAAASPVAFQRAHSFANTIALSGARSGALCAKELWHENMWLDIQRVR